MATIHAGGCACGKVRYETSGDPVDVHICHCKKCQLRTGSAFGTSVYFPKERVKFLSGSLRKVRRSSDSGRWLESEFCENCGTTVTWTLELAEALRGIAGGTYDDAGWLKPNVHIWTESATGWVDYPKDAQLHARQHI
ncbi:MAG: GFA family protein [Dongiaceae bacterium]